MFFWVSLSMLMVFSNFSLILCSQYAWNSGIYIKIGIQTFVWHTSILCIFILKHFSKGYKTFAIFSVKIYYYFNSLVSFFVYFGDFDVFWHVLTFAVTKIWLVSGVLTFAKFVEFLKRSTVREGRYFLIFQPKDMLNLYSNLNVSQPIYAYKCYAYKKRVYQHSSQTWTIYFTISWMQTFLFIKNRPSFFPGTLNILLGKKIIGKKSKERIFVIVCWNFTE